MAVARFAAPVSDTTEEELRLTRIPQKTKQLTEWGVRVWNEWAATCGASSSEAVTDHVPVTNSLLHWCRCRETILLIPHVSCMNQ